MVSSSSHPEEPVIQQSHMYLLIHLFPKIRIHTEYHFPVISFSSLASFQCSLLPTGIFPVTWAYPNVNQNFPSKSRLVCPTVCPVSFRFQQNEKHLDQSEEVLMRNRQVP